MNRIFSILIAGLFWLPRPSLADDTKLAAILGAYLAYKHDSYYCQPHENESLPGQETAASTGISGVTSQLATFHRKGVRAIDLRSDASTLGASTVTTAATAFHFDTSARKSYRLLVLMHRKFSGLEKVLGEKQALRLIDHLIAGWTLDQILKSHLSTKKELREAEEWLQLPWPNKSKDISQIEESIEMVYVCLKAKELDPVLEPTFKELLQEHRQTLNTNEILHRMRLKFSQADILRQESLRRRESDLGEH